MVSWLDRAIASVAPRTATRRVLARQAFEGLARSYEGAARGRRTDGWHAPGSSADAEIGRAGALLRDRMRDLVRNNPHAAKAVSVLVNNIVGAGIMKRAASGDAALDREVDRLFEIWARGCDADGQFDFYGLQTLACREMVEAGEVLVRRRPRRSGDGVMPPVQLQLLEADFLDATRNGALGAGQAVQGIEFDALGRRRAYWLFGAHPGDATLSLTGGITSRAVPASEIAHVYEKQRTQARGVPWGAPVIRALRDLDDYEVAEIVRKKTEACVTAIVFGDEEAQQGIAPAVVDADGNRVEQFEPGLIAYARGGKDIRFNQPAATGGYGEYKRASLHTISAGFRVPYELLTGDLSQVNYSSIRAGLVEFRRSEACAATGPRRAPNRRRPVAALHPDVLRARLALVHRGCVGGRAHPHAGGAGRMVAAEVRGGRPTERCDGGPARHPLRHDDARRGHRPAGSQPRCGAGRDRRHERQARRTRPRARQRPAPGHQDRQRASQCAGRRRDRSGRSGSGLRRIHLWSRRSNCRRSAGRRSCGLPASTLRPAASR
ncbi:phage portal protein [Pseudoponticoccus marisrubri]|uniref:phage portal protein n=1 Tax=Pseudoponticoccus marisrubri TaxID=1685382 RepID=UPI000A86FCA8|nr:phage portal protein [Pseudoponticoccus marisrubri]